MARGPGREIRQVGTECILDHELRVIDHDCVLSGFPYNNVTVSTGV